MRKRKRTEWAEKLRSKRRLFPVFRVFLGFLLLFSLLLLERNGIGYEELVLYKGERNRQALSTMENKPESERKDCLLLYDSRDENSLLALKQFQQILRDMREPFVIRDIAGEAVPFSDLESYRTVLLSLRDISMLGEEILKLDKWVSEGGRAFFGLPIGQSPTLEIIAHHLGIEELGGDYSLVADFRSEPDFMLGSSRVYPIEDGYESSMTVGLSEEAALYATTGDGKTPLIWSMDYGEGRYGVCNFAYCTKAYRGIYASAYSTLEDSFLYPVINGSAFYLDDFPSPVPAGDGHYIERDYQLSIADFYRQVWWPDLEQMSKKYGLRYTGLVIENYNDIVSGELPGNESTADFRYFGNLLLRSGGEIGYHGYNHQPLCGPDYVYEEELGYQNWSSIEEMALSVDTLRSFTEEVFPGTSRTVYVPPSNVLSPEGRTMLGERFPDIHAIASIYLPGGSAYEQEFEVAKDGMVETPRIISGGILDDYNRITAFSELNLHFVNSHFMHPDDLLDEDRGAELGWERMKENIRNYLDWLRAAAPMLRNMRGSEFTEAVRQFAALSVERNYGDGEAADEETKASVEAGIKAGENILYADNLSESKNPIKQSVYLRGEGGDRWFLLRVNDGSEPKIEGASVEKLNGTLYLLHAEGDSIIIR